jgi:hypothetical protein
VPQLSGTDKDFHPVCSNCDCVAISVEGDECVSSTPLVCAKCRFPRGTVGSLRRMSDNDQKFYRDIY